MTQPNLNDLQAQLAEAEGLLEARVQQMQALADGIVDAYKSEFGPRLLVLARQQVKDNHEAAQKIGPDRVKELRAQVEALAADAPQLVDEHLGALPWPHLREANVPESDYERIDSLYKVLTLPTKRLFGVLGQALIAAGVAHGGSWAGDVRSTADWLGSGEAVIAGNYLVSYQDMKGVGAAVDAYQKAGMADWVPAVRRARAAREAVSKQQASDLWDS